MRTKKYPAGTGQSNNLSVKYSSTDNIGEFRNAILGAGFEDVPAIEPGKIHRFPGIGKKRGNKAGYSKLFNDCRGGFYGDYSTGFQANWMAGGRQDFTPEEKARFIREIEQARRQREAEQRQQHQQAATQARQKIEAATPETGTHKYLVAKQVKPYGILTNGYQLLIPVTNINGELQSLQTIDPNGRKLFLPKGRIAGGMFLIGDINPDKTILICEGFATAATLHEETNIPTVAAFNAANLENVAVSIRKKYPKSELIVCGDNDRRTKGNPGVKAATTAAQAVNGKISIPEFPDTQKGTDWNDWYLNQREVLA